MSPQVQILHYCMSDLLIQLANIWDLFGLNTLMRQQIRLKLHTLIQQITPLLRLPRMEVAQLYQEYTIIIPNILSTINYQVIHQDLQLN